MNIILENVSKRYLRRWIFRGLSGEISPGSRLGITGHNGSGKSTLLKILIGALSPSEGSVQFSQGTDVIMGDKAFREIAFAAPYTDLIEELSLREFLGFHTRFRPLKEGVEEREIIQLLGKQFDTGLYMKSFSSGMKQRVRLALAMSTKASVIVLDEPTSNLDAEGKLWYKSMLERVDKGTSVIIASNEHQDMELCTDFIHIPDYSPSK